MVATFVYTGGRADGRALAVFVLELPALGCALVIFCDAKVSHWAPPHCPASPKSK